MTPEEAILRIGLLAGLFLFISAGKYLYLQFKYTRMYNCQLKLIFHQKRQGSIYFFWRVDYLKVIYIKITQKKSNCWMGHSQKGQMRKKDIVKKGPIKKVQE